MTFMICLLLGIIFIVLPIMVVYLGILHLIYKSMEYVFDKMMERDYEKFYKNQRKEKLQSI